MELPHPKPVEIFIFSATAGLTDHHEASLVIENRPVGVDQCLLQLLQVDEATVVRVDGLEPLVRLLVNTGGDVTYRQRGGGVRVVVEW